MSKQQQSRCSATVTIEQGSLHIDLGQIETSQAIVIIADAETTPLDNGLYVVELEGQRLHRLSLANNPPEGAYAVVVMEPEAPQKVPVTCWLQVPVHR